MGEVHDISLDLLRSLEDADVGTADSAASLALSLGRVMAERAMETEEAVRFIQSIFEFCAMYFHEGVTN